MKGNDMLKITRTNFSDTAIYRFASALVHGAETGEMLDALITQRAHRLVLDLEQVHAVDAAGLGTLVCLLNWCENHGIELTVVNPSPRVRSLMEITNLDSVFHINAWQELMSNCPVFAA